MHCKGRSDWADLGVEPILAFFFHNQAPPVCFLPKSFGMVEGLHHSKRLEALDPLGPFVLELVK